MMDRCDGRRGGLPIVSEVARQKCWSCKTFSAMGVFFSSCARTLASVFSDPMSKRWRPPSMERTYSASTLIPIRSLLHPTEPACASYASEDTPRDGGRILAAAEAADAPARGGQLPRQDSGSPPSRGRESTWSAAVSTWFRRPSTPEWNDQAAGDNGHACSVECRQDLALLCLPALAVLRLRTDGASV